MSEAIPAGWKQIPLEEFTTLQRGHDLTKSQFRPGQVPVAGSNGIIGYHDTALAKAPGITVGRSGSVGKVTIYKEDFWPHNTSLHVRDFHGNDPIFAGYLLKSLDLARFKTGASVPTLDRNSFKSLPVVIPPLREQQTIAETLSTVERAIEAQERIILTTTELKQALMQKLFSEGMRGEPQKETEIGLVPESWEVCTVGDVAMIQSGGTPSRENPDNWIGGTIPWVKTGEINYRTIIDTEEKITQHGLNNSSARIFPEGTLLMAMYGQGITRGRVGILGIEAATNQACAAIIPKRKEEVVTKYLYFYFQHSYESLRRMGHGANQKNMNADLIRAFPLALPSPEEQEEVTSIMKTHDDRLQQANLKRLCLTDLFASLLHDLMGGRFLLSSNEQSC